MRRLPCLLLLCMLAQSAFPQYSTDKKLQARLQTLVDSFHGTAGVYVLNLKTGRAWAIKETLRRLWHDIYPAAGWTFWKRWSFWATHSQLEPIRKAAETVRRHIDNIVTYFQHPVTNAMSEGLNSKIQKIKSMACGFRNMHFKTAIYFHCGGLDLYPC